MNPNNQSEIQEHTTFQRTTKFFCSKASWAIALCSALFVLPISSPAQDFAWLKGSTATNSSGLYGSQGAELATYNPRARDSAAAWIDTSGMLWLFGGSDAIQGRLNDLWRFNPASGNWAWFKGASTTNQVGTYSTLGTETTTATPGARAGSACWTDASGNLWLYGGSGYTTSTQSGRLSELWRFNRSTGNWAWIKGSNGLDENGTYGIQGTESPTNNPSGRGSPAYWKDSSGNFWMFGGLGYAQSSFGFLGDLWKYNVTSGNWTWVKGGNSTNQNGIYGTPGVEASGNRPGARHSPVAWTDLAGNLWMFGGTGFDASSSIEGELNDLWRFNISTGNWTWMKGSNAKNQAGNYGTQGIEVSSNTPGSRLDSVSWSDSSGNFWLYGGFGYVTSTSGYLDDLWKYNSVTGNWTWTKGTMSLNQFGVYGSQGVAAPANIAGGRSGSIGLTGASNILYLFGGYGYGAAGVSGNLNDLWAIYAPPPSGINSWALY